MEKLSVAFCAVWLLICHVPLKANSLSNCTDIDAVYNGPDYAGNSLYLMEGCQGGELIITRPNSDIGSLDFQIACTGTADNGNDCVSIAANWNMANGQVVLLIPIETIADELDEGAEILQLMVNCVQITSFAFEVNIEIRDTETLSVIANPVEIYCDQDALLQLEITGGSGLQVVEWATQATGNPYLVTDPTPGNVAYTVTDVCTAIPISTGAVIVTFIPYPVIEVFAGPDITVNCTQDISIDISPTGGNGNYSIQWFINSNPSNSNSDASFFWSGPVTSTVSVIVTDECNIAGVDEIQVTLYNPPPTIAIGDDIAGNCTEVESVNAVVSGGLGASTVSWFYNDIPLGVGYTMNVPIESGGILSAQAQDGCGSIGIDEINVVQSPVQLIADINPIFGMCQSELPVSAQISGGIGDDFIYSWVFQGNEFSTNNTTEVTAIPNELVHLTVQDVCGNTAQVSEPIVLDVQDILVDASAQLLAANCDDLWNVETPGVSGGTGNFLYDWHISGEQSILANTPTFDIDVTGLHNVWLVIEVTDECTNYGIDSTLILLTLPPVSITVETEYSFGCLEDIEIAPFISGGQSPYTYSWSADGNEVGTVAVFATQALLSQVMVLDVTDHCGLHDQSTISIEVLPTNLSVEIIADDATICPNQEVNLLADLSNQFGDPTVLWSTGATSETLTFSVSNDQNISCTVHDVCGNSYTAQYTLSIIPTTGNFTVLDDFMLCNGQESGPLATGGYEPYSYAFTSASIALSDNGVLSMGTTEVPVIVTDACGQSGQVLVDSRSCDFIVPNVFTPNNDTKNDTFEINGLDKFPKSELVVFNRNGDKVFESLDYQNDWTADGLPAGTYYFVLRRNDGEQFESSVAVIR